MTKLAFGFGLTLSATSAFAETRNTIGIDGAFALPVGDYGEVATLAGGALVRIEVPLASGGFVTGRGGVLLHAVNRDLGMTSLTLVPIYAGYRHPFGSMYVAGELGLTIGFVTAEASTPFGNVDGSDSDLDLGLTVGIGYRSGKLDLRGSLFSPNAEDVALLATAGFDFAAF
jgi:hypothetical protein